MNERLAVSSASVSALEDIVDYINDHVRQLASGTAEPGFSAQSAVLEVRGGVVRARIGPFVLGSAPRALVPPGGSRPHARLAHIAVRLASGRPVAPDILFRLQSTAPALVALDRLCRIVHMLQHLEQQREDEDLWLHVSLRHALAVTQGHGQFFDTLLRRCGLGPARIVLVLPVLPTDDSGFERYAAALANYRAAGYRLALDVREPCRETIRAALLELRPDWLRLRARDLAHLDAGAAAHGLLLRGAAADQALPAAQQLLFENPLGALLPRFLL